MFFRNLTFFRMPGTWGGLFQTSVAEDFTGIDQHLAAAALKPVGPLEMSSRRFVSPFGRGDGAYSHSVGDCTWIAVGGEDKILPAAVVNELLAQKIDEIEEREGRRPGGKTRKRLKDDLLHELLPRAFVKLSRTDAYFDFARGFICVDTSSRRTGEAIVSEVRRACGTFPALPVNAEVAPRVILTGWLAGEPLPDGLALGEECELRDAMDGGAVVKCQYQDLRCEEIEKHLEAGKQVTRLALTLYDHVSFVLGEDLTLRKVRFLDGAVDALENTEHDDLRAELDARFVLMTGEVGRLFDLLERALRISKVGG